MSAVHEKLERVTSYRTTDGQTFTDELEAAEHQVELDVRGEAERFAKAYCAERDYRDRRKVQVIDAVLAWEKARLADVGPKPPEAHNPDVAA